MAYALKIVIIVITAVVIGAGGYFWVVAPRKAAPTQNQKNNTISVTKGVIIEEITFNGTVKPSQEVRLSFERAGMVRTLPFRVGEKTRAGDLVAALDKADIITQIAKAEADTAFEEAKLEELKRGPRAEELRVADVKVENAKKTLEDSLNNVFSSLLDAFTKSDDAVRNKLDQIIDNPHGSNPQIKSELAAGNSSLEQIIESNRFLAEGKLTGGNKSLALLTTTDTLALKKNVEEAKQHLFFIRSLLGDAALLLSTATGNINIPQQTIEGYRSAVGIGRINIETAYSNIVAAEKGWQGSQSAITLAEEEKKLVEVGSSPEEIAAQEARIKRTKAVLDGARVELKKMTLLSPINGVLTRMDIKIGETVVAGQIVAGVINDENFEVKINVPETNIAKIAVGNEAVITLDAYGPGVKFYGKLVRINPAEKIIEGVTTYESTLEFSEADPRIKSGMTADVVFNIKKDDVLVLPQTAVTRKRGIPYAAVVNEKGVVLERRIRIGSIGIDGLIEIIDGLKEGEIVVESYAVN